MKPKKRVTTAGELVRMLNHWPSDTEIIFQGGMTLYRLKDRGPGLVQIEFDEPVQDAMRLLSEAQNRR